MQKGKICTASSWKWIMKGTQLGEFEEIVLLAIALLHDDAYSVAIVEELSERLERPMSLGAVHRTMQRLEEKGLVQSRFGDATAERGGRRKRLFTVTVAGEQSLREARRIRNELWDQIPVTAFGN
jgi:DNA-binding PadR family transcriptional regulator